YENFPKDEYVSRIYEGPRYGIAINLDKKIISWGKIINNNPEFYDSYIDDFQDIICCENVAFFLKDGYIIPSDINSNFRNLDIKFKSIIAPSFYNFKKYLLGITENDNV